MTFLTVQLLVSLSMLILLSSICTIVLLTLSLIRQNGKSQNGGNKKIRHAKFSEKRTFLTPWYAYVRVCVRRKVYFFSENLACFVFVLPPFCDSPFVLLPMICDISLRLLLNLNHNEGWDKKLPFNYTTKNSTNFINVILRVVLNYLFRC